MTRDTAWGTDVYHQAPTLVELGTVATFTLGSKSNDTADMNVARYN